MDTNLLTDTIYNKLHSLNSNVYVNKPPSNPSYPYVILFIDSNISVESSEDFYIHIDIYDDENKSIRGMNDLADLIDNGFNDLVINEVGLNVHITRENRQFIDNDELSEKRLISLRYNTRVYFK